MDTKLATTNIRLHQWAAVFKARAESGLTVNEYCEQNDLSRNAYYYWLRRVKTTALESTPCSFVELNAADSGSSTIIPADVPFFVSQLTLEKNGFVIRVNEKTPKDLLIMALEVAAHA